MHERQGPRSKIKGKLGETIGSELPGVEIYMVGGLGKHFLVEDDQD